MKFSIRDIMLTTVIVALAVGWWIEHRRFAGDVAQLSGICPERQITT
jgi:hypothetical protein